MQDFSKHVKSANCLARSSGALTMANLTSCLVARLREYISLLERVRLVGGTHYFGQEARGVDCDTQLRGCSNQIRLKSHCVVHKTYGNSIVKVLLCCLSRCKPWSFGDSIEPAWPRALWTQDDRISNYPVITVTILIYSWISLRPSSYSGLRMRLLWWFIIEVSFSFNMKIYEDDFFISLKRHEYPAVNFSLSPSIYCV